MALAQEQTQDVTLTLVPEQTRRDSTGTTALVVIVENRTAEDLGIATFALANPNLALTAIGALPTDIAAGTVVTGTYAVELAQATTYGLVGTLTYTRTGAQRIATAHTEVTVVATTGWENWQDLLSNALLVLVGAVISLLGGLVKGWFDDRRQFGQQVKRALGVLLPALAVCARAVEQNRAAPLDLWQEVYFKEGLHTALEQQAQRRKKVPITDDIPQLYARLREYNENRQLVDRSELTADLQRTEAALHELM
jgi:hypothetical protein